MPFDKFFNNLYCVEKDAVWWSFRINDNVGKRIAKKQIQTKKKYVTLRNINGRQEIKKTV